MLTDIPTYYVLDFSRQVLQLKENKSRESAILNQVPSIVLGFFNFHFPIDFIGGQ